MQPVLDGKRDVENCCYLKQADHGFTMPSITQFEKAWRRFEKEGLLDNYGSRVFAKYLQNWFLSDCPQDVDSFLQGIYTKTDLHHSLEIYRELFKSVWKIDYKQDVVPSLGSQEYATAYKIWQQDGRYHEVVLFILEWIEAEKLMRRYSTR